MSFTHSAAGCRSLRLPSTKYFVVDQHAGVVSPTGQFFYSFIFVCYVDLWCVDSGWLENWLGHFLASFIVVITGEVDGAVDTVGEKWVVISCCDQIDRILQFDLNGDILNSPAAKCSFVIAAECENSAVSCQYNWVNAATRYLEYGLVEQRIGYLLLGFAVLSLIVFIIVVDGELLYIGQAEGFSWVRILCG